MLKLYNTLKRKKQIFKPLKDKKVGFYACGPTVYWYAHIGNLRTYIFEDILKRVLKYNGFRIKHVMNITDVGHLTSDADSGEDKIEKEAKKEKKTARQIANFYAKTFKNDIKRLNIEPPDIWIKASDYIKEQISLVKNLEKKGFTYRIADGIYFDASKIKDYGKLSGGKKKNLKAGARVKIAAGKKNPADFALWKFSPKSTKRQMEWDSPWGKGFPGWHTECAAMGIKRLGIPFDIHCGAIDHIPIHHSNEIAQVQAIYNKNLANYWLHGEFLILKREKMAKSRGNIITLNELIKKGFNPLAYRYLCLGTHYRKRLVFFWKSLEAAQNGLEKLFQTALTLKKQSSKTSSKIQKDYLKKFSDFINDDLNMPRALALMWDLIKEKKISESEKYNLLLKFDKIFGLGLDKIKIPKIPIEIKKMAKQRDKCRQKKNWSQADRIRKKIENLGYQIEDLKKETVIKKLRS